MSMRNYQENGKLKLLTKHYFGFEYDEGLQKWLFCEDSSINFIQWDLYIAFREAIFRTALIWLIGEKSKKSTNPEYSGLLGELFLTFEKGLLVDLRTLVRPEKGKDEVLGTKTGGDFIKDLQKIISELGDAQIKQAIGRFNSADYGNKVHELEGKLLHKDSHPEKRTYIKDTYTTWNGLRVKAKQYRQFVLNDEDIFPVLESFSDIIKYYIDMMGLPRNLVFPHNYILLNLVEAFLQEFRINDAGLAEKIVSHIKEGLPKTTSLVSQG